MTHRSLTCSKVPCVQNECCVVQTELHYTKKKLHLNSVAVHIKFCVMYRQPMLPDNIHKLLAQWQGPFQVTRKVGPVNYEVLRTRLVCRKQIYHINLLKKWHPQEGWPMQRNGDLDDLGGPEISQGVGEQPKVEGTLKREQERLKEIIKELQDVVNKIPREA